MGRVLAGRSLPRISDIPGGGREKKWSRVLTLPACPPRPTPPARSGCYRTLCAACSLSSWVLHLPGPGHSRSCVGFGGLGRGPWDGSEPSAAIPAGDEEADSDEAPGPQGLGRQPGTPALPTAPSPPLPAKVPKVLRSVCSLVASVFFLFPSVPGPVIFSFWKQHCAEIIVLLGNEAESLVCSKKIFFFHTQVLSAP